MPKHSLQQCVLSIYKVRAHYVKGHHINSTWGTVTFHIKGDVHYRELTESKCYHQHLHVQSLFRESYTN